MIPLPYDHHHDGTVTIRAMIPQLINKYNEHIQYKNYIVVKDQVD